MHGQATAGIAILLLLLLQAASLELKKILQDESVCFYVSPFLRSRQTFQQLKQAFRDDQVRAKS